jgi:hypothetical protein
MTTRQPARALVGNCPTCGALIIVENNGETWPLVTCRCGWRGDVPFEGAHLHERADR